LQKLDSDGYCSEYQPPLLTLPDSSRYQVVIFSNQGGLTLREDPKSKAPNKRLNDYKTKITAIFNNLDITISLYAATEKDNYRKPRSRMWNEALEHFDLDGDNVVDMDNSFYVGDAAGREGDGQRSNDFASSDR